VWFVAPVLDAVIPTPQPGPDPDPPVLPDPPPGLPPSPPQAGAVRWVVAVNQLTRGTLAHFPSARVGEFDRAVWSVDPTRADVSVSASDDGWSELARRLGVAGVNVRGRTRWTGWGDLLECVGWQVWERTRGGVVSCVVDAMSAGPVQVGDMVDLRLAGGGRRCESRSVGAGGTRDWLSPWGTFDGESGASWVRPPGAGPSRYRSGGHASARSLLCWPGETISPLSRVLPGGSVDRIVTAVLRVDTSAMPAGSAVAVHAVGWRVDAPGSASGPLSTAVVPRSGWQEVAANVSLPAPGDWRVQVVVGVLGPVPAPIDLVRVVADDLFGSLTPKPLAWYPGHLLERAQSPQSGGPIGLRAKLRRPTPSSVPAEAIRWREHEDPSLIEALRSVVDRADGPDVWITTDGVLQVDGVRRGSDRPDLCLSEDVVLSADVSRDPSSVAHQVRVVVSAGGGSTREVIAADREVPTGVIARRAFYPAPTELSYRAAAAWSRGVGASLGSDPLVADVTVPSWWGRMVACGDSLPVALASGLLASVGWVRVSQITEDPGAETMRLVCGAVG
jgi:hypothetical protein